MHQQRALIAYYSMTGNANVAVEAIAAALDADLDAIRTNSSASLLQP
jgi:flavodoxin